MDAVPQHLLVRRGESASENASATAQRRPRAGFHYKRHQLKLAGDVDVRVTVLLALAYVAFVAFDFIQTPVARVLALVVGAVVAIIYLALTRVVPEFSMAVFRMSDNIQAIKRQPSI